jgi:hypothetical protein
MMTTDKRLRLEFTLLLAAHLITLAWAIESVIVWLR